MYIYIHADLQIHVTKREDSVANKDRRL